MKPAARGFSLIELMITLAIVGLLMALGAPSFGTWRQNTKIRTAAESIQNGLQLARGEAVRRNAIIRFQLTDNVGGGCALSTTATNWVVSYDNPAGSCNAPLLNEDWPVDNAVNNPAPRIIRVRSAAEGSSNIVVNTDAGLFVAFNGLGRRVVPIASALPPTRTFSILPDPAAGSCATLRCLQVDVTVGGQVRMCDPALNGSTDPQRCF